MENVDIWRSSAKSSRNRHDPDILRYTLTTRPGYLILIIFWDVGGGYNEFDLANSTIRLVRRGFPGENRNILLSYPLNEIKSLEVEVKEGINPRRALYLITVDKRRIPLTGIGDPMPLFLLEEKATTLAKFLNIPYNYA